MVAFGGDPRTEWRFYGGFNGKMLENPLSIMEHSLKLFFWERSTHYEWEMVTLNHNSWEPVLVWGINLTPGKSTFSGNQQISLRKSLAFRGRIPPAENHLW
jgi:hypothetical protein